MTQLEFAQNFVDEIALSFPEIVGRKAVKVTKGKLGETFVVLDDGRSLVPSVEIGKQLQECE